MNCESFHLGLVSYWLADLYLVPLVFFLLFVSSLGGEGELVLTVRQNHGTEIIGKLMRSGGCWEEIERCGFPDACWSSTTPPLFTCSPRFSQRIISGWGSCALVVQNVIPLSSLYICMLHVELEPAQDYLILAQRLEYWLIGTLNLVCLIKNLFLLLLFATLLPCSV